jgi:hypothetical protein
MIPPPSDGAPMPRTSIARAATANTNWICWRLILLAKMAKLANLLFMGHHPFLFVMKKIYNFLGFKTGFKIGLKNQ